MKNIQTCLRFEFVPMRPKLQILKFSKKLNSSQREQTDILKIENLDETSISLSLDELRVYVVPDSI